MGRRWEESLPTGRHAMSQLHQILIDAVLAKKPARRPVVVGINGVDASGKSILAAELARCLRDRDVPACVISVDGFHHPRERRYRRGEHAAEAYYHDTIDFSALVETALKPVVESEAFPVRCVTHHFDLMADKPRKEFAEIGRDSAVIVEGIFLFREEILPYLDLRIFIEVEFEAVLSRTAVRDRSVFGSEAAVEARYRQKYIPGQMLYLDEVNPKRIADIVIDNNDYENPKLIVRRGT